MKFRSNKTEMLDAGNIPKEDLYQNLFELQWINKWLGGHKISLKGFNKVAGNKRNISLCEIGCGGGDNIAFLLQKKSKFISKVFGIDLKQDCIEYAKKNPVLSDIIFIQSDYKMHPFEDKPDIIFSSLFCHHFSDEELVQQVIWMKNNSNIGFFINDLQRNYFAYHSIRILTGFFSKSYLVKNDAPISVARALKKKEWEVIFKKAGIENYRIKWQWAFRYLITFIHAGK